MLGAPPPPRCVLTLKRRSLWYCVPLQTPNPTQLSKHMRRCHPPTPRPPPPFFSPEKKKSLKHRKLCSGFLRNPAPHQLIESGCRTCQSIDQSINWKNFEEHTATPARPPLPHVVSLPSQVLRTVFVYIPVCTKTDYEEAGFFSHSPIFLPRPLFSFSLHHPSFPFYWFPSPHRPASPWTDSCTPNYWWIMSLEWTYTYMNRMSESVFLRCTKTGLPYRGETDWYRWYK